MIRPHIIQRIFRRELLDTLRDWNVVFVVVILPFILTPLAIITTIESTAQSEAEVSESTGGRAGTAGKSDLPRYKIALVGKGAAEFQEKAAAHAQLTNVQVPDLAPPDPYRSDKRKVFQKEAYKKISEGTVDAVLVCTETVGQKSGLRNYGLIILTDETLPRSKKAGVVLEKIGEEWRKQYRAERLKIRGETEGTLQPLVVVSEELAPLPRKLAYLFASVAPVFLFLLLLTGCFCSAIQAIPGEKERGTLATILSAPVRPLELLLGKWMNVMIIGISGALANTGSLLLTLVLALTSMSKQIQGDSKTSIPQFLWEQGMTWNAIPWGGLALLAATLIALTMVFSALSLVLCMFARGINDATYLLTPAILVICIPAGVASLPSTEWTLGTAIIPVLNNAVLIREIFRQAPLQPGLVVAAFSSCVLFSMGLLFLGARIFASEGIRFSAPSSTNFLKRPFASVVNSAASFVATFLLLGGSFYFAIAAAGMQLRFQALAMQAWMVAVPLGLIWYLRLPVREALAWHSVPWKPWIGIACVGLAAWVLPMPFVALFPMPEALAKVFYEALRQFVTGTGGLAAGFLLLAILPAVCEEIAFRGFIQTGLQKRFSPGIAIILTSLCFGLAHFSVYRFLPTFILGLLLGWVRWRTKSVFPSMVIHGLNNGLVVLTLAASPVTNVTPEIPSWPVLAVAVMVLTFGIGWTIKTTKPAAVAKTV